MDYSAMSRTELESHLTRLKSNFEDLEETIAFNFSNTTSHIGGSQVRKDIDMLNEMKQEIRSIESMLSGMDNN